MCVCVCVCVCGVCVCVCVSVFFSQQQYLFLLSFRLCCTAALSLSLCKGILYFNLRSVRYLLTSNLIVFKFHWMIFQPLYVIFIIILNE